MTLCAAIGAAIERNAMKLLTVISFFLFAGTATAQLNQTPVAQSPRLKFVCYTDQEDGLPDYQLHVLVDWEAEFAKGQAILLTDLPRTNYDEPRRQRLVARFPLEIFSDENGFEQFLRQSNGTSQNNLQILWRSEFEDSVPAEHFLILKGKKYRFQYCQGVDSDSRANHTTPGYGNHRRGLYGFY
jgi:hypothetical protein